MIPTTTGSELDRKFIAAFEHLDSLGPRRGGLLAAELDVTAATIGDAVTVLHDKGIVDRAPDPDDGRAIQAALTTNDLPIPILGDASCYEPISRMQTSALIAVTTVLPQARR